LPFVNRAEELGLLEQWWAIPGGRLALVWGRRRVGKTALVEHFAGGRRTVFHTATSRPPADELGRLSDAVAPLLVDSLRDLGRRPFADWLDALETLASVARDDPLLLVLDEFPELVAGDGDLPSTLRAFWDRARTRTQLRLILCGSAVRTMESLQEERSPLHGRVDLRLIVHAFRPREAAGMLAPLPPAERALVWGLLGGVPLYLSWWDPARTVAANLEALVCRPGALLLTEGEYVLATDAGRGELGRRVLHAVATGRTKFNEIESTVRTNPARTLDDLVALRFLERLAPVTEDPTRTRRTTYRVADNFLAFWLGVVDRYRAEIERGLGPSILPVLLAELDDFMGPRWEAAYREHLRHLAATGGLPGQPVAVGAFWTTGSDAVEIDAVVLGGRERRPLLVGEAKWTRVVDARPLLRDLLRKAAALPGPPAPDLLLSVCARETVRHAEGALAVTAADIFAAPGESPG
jgi:hypothetical protein